MSRWILAALFLWVTKAGAVGSTIMLFPVGGGNCAGASLVPASPMFLPGGNCFINRGSIGTYTDVSGVIQTAATSVPRVDYAPVAHTLNGTLLEPAATNLVPNSTNLSSNTYWTNNGTPTYTQDTTAPDGSTAYSISSSQTFSGRWKGVPLVASSTFTLSVYLKYVSGDTTSRIGVASSFIDINSQTGAVIGSSGTTGTPTVTAVGNGWYRAVMSFVAAGASSNVSVYNRNAPATKIAYWGIQTELGSVATSYIATTSGAVTRAADVYAQP